MGDRKVAFFVAAASRQFAILSVRNFNMRAVPLPTSLLIHFQLD